MKYFLCILALLGVAGAADKAQTCPVQIVKFSSHGSAADYSYPGHADLTLLNTTSKEVKAAVLKLAAVDAVGDVHEFAVTPELELTHAIKPGAQRKANWTIHTKDGQRLRVWVSAVRFEDGTVWHDDNSHSCSK